MRNQHTPAPWAAHESRVTGPQGEPIAAAPDLLAALEQINNVALGHPYAGCTCGEIARAAIAKARGE